MSNRPGLFTASRHPVLSLLAHAESKTTPRERSLFEVLVRHLLHRFLHNDLLASDDETKRILQISYAVALPGLLFAMYLFPAYHAFPPFPYPRPFWSQVGDHYFYVMYALVIMGAATVYEWDLLFPDLLDVFVLSILPITNRRLFFARVLALALFLALVLLGTSILGLIVLPLVADLPEAGRHLFAHAVAVGMSGSFAAASFLALQGILLNTVGERLFRRITPLLQGASLMLMLTILLLYPTLARTLELLLNSGSPVVRCFPPFWFLGVYECLLHGHAAPAIFGQLARTGVLALIVMLSLTLLTYPLAYRRRVRQIIEGGATTQSSKRAATPLHRLLHAAMLRLPTQRAIFYFISQTVLRSPRHRLMLAMYGGLGVSLTLSNMIVLYLNGHHVRVALMPYGIRAAVPIMAFWTVAGLRSVIAAPVDRRGTWLFRVLVGRPLAGHLAGARHWVTAWAVIVSMGTALLLHLLAPASLRTPLVFAGQLLVAFGSSFLLSDVFLYPARTIPFTSLHKSAITDFPLMIFRYIVLFPALIAIVVHYEPAIERSPAHLLATLFLLTGVHRLLVHAHTRSLEQSTGDTSPDEVEDFPQSLGLRNS